jgi:ribosomal protein S27AE
VDHRGFVRHKNKSYFGKVDSSWNTVEMAKSSKDYTRVCKRCGTARLIPEAYVKDKPPRASQVSSMQRASRFAVGKQRERYSIQASSLAGQQDRYLTNATCPNCGSTEFDQYAPGKEPPGVTIGAAVASADVVTATSPPTPPQWAADPHNRHELRFWDGAAWTAAVVDAGVPGIDSAQS